MQKNNRVLKLGVVFVTLFWRPTFLRKLQQASVVPKKPRSSPH